MRQVIEKHITSLGFVVDACASYDEASDSLRHQYQNFGAEYACAVFGWPTAAQDDADSFARQLDSGEHKDLPVVVMSSDMRAETRAWVAARENTSLLGWKVYQQLDVHLQQHIDSEFPNADTANRTMTSMADNNDIHLLVVDNSATIRHALRDLFHSQGYRVTLAVNAEDAMTLASQTSIDIAVLDYYLNETTGDSLCRSLLAADSTGELMCTVLTGTYSDHIIKRSLRAGAIECMFKNESSDMLLSRIGAISRLVRQRRQLQAQKQLLDNVLDHIAGPVIVIGRDQRITYLNKLAVQELGLKELNQLLSQDASELLEKDPLQPHGDKLHAATWQLPNGASVEVDYQHTRIETSGHSLLRFTRRVVSIDNADLIVLQQNTSSDALSANVIRQFSLLDDCKPFFLQTCHYLEEARQTGTTSSEEKQPSMQVSLLIIDVFVKETNSTLQPVGSNEALAAQVRTALYGLAARAHHVAELTENRYGFLLRHAEEKQAFVLTRKILQRCLQVTPADHASGELGALACFGSLLNLSQNAEQPVNLLVQHVFKGLELIKGREPNQAILLDVRRLLSAFPTDPAEDAIRE